MDVQRLILLDVNSAGRFKMTWRRRLCGIQSVPRRLSYLKCGDHSQASCYVRKQMTSYERVAMAGLFQSGRIFSAQPAGRFRIYWIRQEYLTKQHLWRVMQFRDTRRKLIQVDDPTTGVSSLH